MGPSPRSNGGVHEQTVIEQTVRPGQALKELSEEAGVPVRYSCMETACRICDVTINGVVTPACMNKIERNGSDLVISTARRTRRAVRARGAEGGARRREGGEGGGGRGAGAAPAPPPAPMPPSCQAGAAELELPNPFDAP